MKKAWTIAEAIEQTHAVAWCGKACEVQAMRNAEQFARFFGPGCTLDTILTSNIDRWIDYLSRQGLSNATINRYLACASKLFTVALQRGGVVAKPHFARRPEPTGRMRFFAPEEEGALLSWMQRQGHAEAADLAAVLVDTGLRLSEALGLDRVDLDGPFLRVWTTKNGEPRSVPMTSRVKAILSNRLPWTLTRFAFRAQWDKARAAMGMTGDPGFIPHTLRHTCASRLVQRGVHLKVVQQWLGHKSITVTMRYAHLAPKDLLDAVHVLE
ncbi:MAG: tyrosine-type recombinase/integrase [Anaerolineales bacterium]